MRPLGIVLAIASATLILSFPYFAYGYSQHSPGLPYDVLAVAGVLMALAIVIAALESWDQNEDADRLAKATEVSAMAMSRMADAMLSSTRAPPAPPPVSSPPPPTG